MAERGNGELSVSHPLLGSLTISGRDLLLAGVLLILGAGAVGVQWMTLTAFQQAFARDLTRVFAQASRASEERDEILGILRAQSCGEALTRPRRPEMTK